MTDDTNFEFHRRTVMQSMAASLTFPGGSLLQEEAEEDWHASDERELKALLLEKTPYEENPEELAEEIAEEEDVSVEHAVEIIERTNESFERDVERFIEGVEEHVVPRTSADSLYPLTLSHPVFDWFQENRPETLVEEELGDAEFSEDTPSLEFIEDGV